MPFLPTSIPISLGGGGGFLETLLGAAPGIIGALGLGPAGQQQPTALPGGAPTQVLQLPSFDIPGIDITPQGTAALGRAFRPTAAGASAQRHLRINPVTGRATWFGPLGRPMLFSGDFAAKRRVEKIAGRAARRARRGRR